jgi:hypothetical protein
MAKKIKILIIVEGGNISVVKSNADEHEVEVVVADVDNAEYEVENMSRWRKKLDSAVKKMPNEILPEVF